MKTKAESLFGEMCKNAEKAMNQLTKGLPIADIVVREQEEAITESLEDRFAPRSYGPLFIEEMKAKVTFTIGDAVYREDGTKRSLTRCIDCKHHHPAVWGRPTKPLKEGSCKESSKFETYNDMIYWTCPIFEAKEELMRYAGQDPKMAVMPPDEPEPKKRPEHPLNSKKEK